MLVKCKACEKEIAKGVKKCVNCGADQRNFAGRHKILTGIAVLIVLGIGSSAMSGGDKPTTTTTTASTSPVTSSATTAPTATAAPVVTAAPLSNEGVSSDVKIKVLEVTTPAYTGIEGAKYSPQGSFVVVKVSIQNNQKDAITVSDASFKLLDKDKREFSSSSEGTMGLAMAQKKTLMFSTVNPGNTIEAYIAYDVPKGLTGFTMEAAGGMTGTPIILKVN